VYWDAGGIVILAKGAFNLHLSQLVMGIQQQQELKISTKCNVIYKLQLSAGLN